MNMVSYSVVPEKVTSESGDLIETYGLACHHGKLKIYALHDIATDKALVHQMADLFTYTQTCPLKCRKIVKYLLAVDSRFWNHLASI